MQTKKVLKAECSTRKKAQAFQLGLDTHAGQLGLDTHAGQLGLDTHVMRITATGFLGMCLNFNWKSKDTDEYAVHLCVYNVATILYPILD